MRILYLAAPLLSLALISPAAAQTQCGPIEIVEATLRDDFGEKPLIEWDLQLAEGAPNRTARIYANTESGTLTIIIVFEQGGRSIACLGGSGQNMRIAPQFKVQEMPL